MSTGAPEPTDDQDLFGKILIIGGLALMLPSAIPAVRDRIVTWLLEHQLLVAAPDALIALPFIDAGLDLRRLVLWVAALAALGWISSRLIAQHRSTATKGAGRG